MGSNPTYSASFNWKVKRLPQIVPTEEEQAHRDQVMRTILEHVRENRTIKLPPFDPANSSPSPNYALLSVGLEPNPFRGTLSTFLYQLEGEEDLLHLIVTSQDGHPLSPEEGQTVAGFVLQGLPTAMIWMRPGEFSQHFYFGHDELINHLAL